MALAALLASGFTARAQTATNTPLPAQQNFVQTATLWLTTIDYTKSWPTNEFDLSTGAKWLNNVNWANYVAAQKDFGNIAVDAEMANQGIAGVIERGQGGLGYRILNRGDTAAHFFADGGYDRTAHSAFIEPKATIRKLLSNTGAFLEIGLTYPVLFKGPQPKYPGLNIGAGATF